jgi:hypothetical protein
VACRPPPDPLQGRLFQRSGPERFLQIRVPALFTTRPMGFVCLLTNELLSNPYRSLVTWIEERTYGTKRRAHSSELQLTGSSIYTIVCFPLSMKPRAGVPWLKLIWHDSNIIPVDRAGSRKRRNSGKHKHRRKGTFQFFFTRSPSKTACPPYLSIEANKGPAARCLGT